MTPVRTECVTHRNRFAVSAVVRITFKIQNFQTSAFRDLRLIGRHAILRGKQLTDVSEEPSAFISNIKQSNAVSPSSFVGFLCTFLLFCT
jgi:hypothetical protein